MLGLASGIGSPASFRTKSDALKFAIEHCTKYTDDGNIVEYDKVNELYEFICGKVPLADSDEDIKSILKDVSEILREFTSSRENTPEENAVRE